MLTISKLNGIHHIGPTLNSFWKWCSFQWHSLQKCIPPKTNMELENTPWKQTFINHHHLFWFPCLFSDVAHMFSLLRNHILCSSTCKNNFHLFSRMRSEGFPFIVGVWGWTCVRVVLLCRRRLVVVSSSSRRRGVVNSLPLGGTFALRSNPYLQSVKSGGRLARNARFGGPKSHNVRSFLCFA